MHARELLDVSLDETGVRLLLSLPAPETADLKIDSPEDARKVQNHLYKLWHDLLVKNHPIPIDKHAWECDQGHRHETISRDIIERLFLTIVGYFEFLFKSSCCKSRTGSQDLPDYFVIHSFWRFHSCPSCGTLEHDDVLGDMRSASFDYFSARFCLYFTYMFRRIPLDVSQIKVFEHHFHKAVRDLYRLSSSLDRVNVKIAVRRLLEGVLECATLVYEDFAQLQTDHKPEVFSTIRLDELAALASRNEALISRYGEKRIEKIFERQLSLIMQSFGLYVVPTETGQSTADLLCISRDPLNHFSFLVEAKTTKGPYSLPKKDARALRDYVRDVKKSLYSLPSIAFVLIVGHAATKTLAKKLRQLEVECEIPVRFIRASDLAALREQLPGPLPLQVFGSQIISSSMVLSEDFVQTVVESSNAEQQAHQSFVKSMLSAHGIIGPAQQQWAHDSHSEMPKPHPE